MNYYNKYLKYKQKYLQMKYTTENPIRRGFFGNIIETRDIYQGTCAIPTDFNIQEYINKANDMHKKIEDLKLSNSVEIERIQKDLKIVNKLNKKIKYCNTRIEILTKRKETIRPILSSREIFINLLNNQITTYQSRLLTHSNELMQIENPIKNLETYQTIKDYNNILCSIKTYLTDYHEDKLIKFI